MCGSKCEPWYFKCGFVAWLGALMHIMSIFISVDFLFFFLAVESIHIPVTDHFHERLRFASGGGDMVDVITFWG